MLEVLKKFPEGMNEREVYRMMKSSDVKKMIEADGSILEVTSWINYVDGDENSPEFKEVLVLKTEDGEIFGTISTVFIRDFKDIVAYFGDDVGSIKVSTGKTKNDRTFVTCTVV